MNKKSQKLCFFIKLCFRYYLFSVLLRKNRAESPESQPDHNFFPQLCFKLMSRSLPLTTCRPVEVPTEVAPTQRFGAKFRHYSRHKALAIHSGTTTERVRTDTVSKRHQNLGWLAPTRILLGTAEKNYKVSRN